MANEFNQPNVGINISVHPTEKDLTNNTSPDRNLNETRTASQTTSSPNAVSSPCITSNQPLTSQPKVVQSQQMDIGTSSCLQVANMNSYLQNKIWTDMEAFAEGGRLQSGYANLDLITNLYPGLYVIGAISSLGKTTFVHQMCDQMAQNGQHVLFFSLEQSILELASKSISRMMAIKNPDSAWTSLQIRKYGKNQKVFDAAQEYAKFSKNMTIVACSFRATIDDIENYVTSYIKKYNVKPVVVVDYLQVIQISSRRAMNSKDAVDMHVRRLKQLQSDHNIVLILISSLNRQNYMTQIDFESFKESGGIEYTADVVWGLQLSVLHEEVFDSQSKLNEKRKKIRDAKAQNPRKVELVCVKNRFGISSYSCKFDYYPQFDWFCPDMDGITDEMLANNADPDGFTSIPAGMKIAFEE